MKHLTNSLVVLLVLLMSTSAWAACKSRHIRGLYLVYVDMGRKVDICALGVTSNGTLVSGSSCLSGRVSGRLQVRSDCIVSGTVGRASVGGSMEKDKNTITGAFTIGRKPGLFTAVRHARFSGDPAALLPSASTVSKGVSAE